MKKRIATAILVILSIVTVSTLTVGVVKMMYPSVSDQKPIGLDDTNERPAFEAIVSELPPLPALDNQTAAIDFIMTLYDRAQSNYKNAEAAMTMISSATTTMGVPVYGQRFILKNGTEYWYSEYSEVSKDSGTLGLIVGVFDPYSTEFAKLKYASTAMDEMYVQTTLKPQINEEAPFDQRYTVDWDNAKNLRLTTEKVPIFNADQNGSFRLTDQTVLKETILEVKELTYHADQGYYDIFFLLDHNNPKTTEITRPVLQQSSGAADAAYYYMEMRVQIWDNGYFKYVREINKWRGNRGFIKLDSTIDFESVYYYDAQHTDPDAYQYFDLVKQNANS